MYTIQVKKYGIPLILETPSKFKKCFNPTTDDICVQEKKQIKKINDEMALINTMGITNKKVKLKNDLKDIPTNTNNNIYYSLINYC